MKAKLGGEGWVDGEGRGRGAGIGLGEELREWSAGDNGQVQCMRGAQWDGEKREGQWWKVGR